MELKINFTTLPVGLDFDAVKGDLASIMEDDGLVVGSAMNEQGGHIEMELEDEKANPKYGILTVKGYLQKANFAKDTTIELAGMAVGIYE